MALPQVSWGQSVEKEFGDCKAQEFGFWGSKAVGRHTLTQQGRGTGGAPAPAPGCHLCWDLLELLLALPHLPQEILPALSCHWSSLWDLTAPPGWLLGAVSGHLCCPCTACEDGGTGSTEGQCHQCHHPSLQPRGASTGDLSKTDPMWGQYFLRGCSVCRSPLLLSPVGLTLCQSRGRPRAAVCAPGWRQHIQHPDPADPAVGLGWGSPLGQGCAR